MSKKVNHAKYGQVKSCQTFYHPEDYHCLVVPRLPVWNWFLLISIEIDNGERRILSWDCPFGRSVPMSYEQIFTLFIQRNICHWIFFISVEIENGERRILSRDCPFGRSAPMLYQLICWQQLLNKRNHGNSLKTVFVSRSPKHNKTESAKLKGIVLRSYISSRYILRFLDAVTSPVSTYFRVDNLVESEDNLHKSRHTYRLSLILPYFKVFKKTTKFKRVFF